MRLVLSLVVVFAVSVVAQEAPTISLDALKRENLQLRSELAEAQACLASVECLQIKFAILQAAAQIPAGNTSPKSPESR